jgi:putative colanic acid biosysnthesis UDP-glucose lipid carrier transferase
MSRIGTVNRDLRVTAWDSAFVFLVKSLLCPSAAVVCLWLSLLISHEPVRPAYFLTGVLAFLAAADLLDFTRPQNKSGLAPSILSESLVSIALQWFGVVGFMWALIWLSGLDVHFSRLVFLTWGLITPPILWASRLVARQMLQSLAAAGGAPRNAVIVGRNELGKLLHTKLSADQSLRIRVLGYCDDRASHGSHVLPALDDTQQRDSVLGKPSQLHDLIARHDVHIVYITWPMTRESRILELLDMLRDSTVSIYFVPDVSIVNLVQGRVDLVNGIPVVGVCESPFYGLRGLSKRFFDVVLASVGIALTAPLLLAIAIGVRLSSPGPIIFKQRRYGLDGKQIVVYKFRSMSVTEDGRTTFTSAKRNDARVTQFGAFIRRTSLDELPQLFNVLAGSMSIVGPRPLVIATNERYRRLLSGYMVRHKVKPGMTGWAQVNGMRGGDDFASMRRRLDLDLQYLQNWSLSLDVAILVKTLKLVMGDRHAF